LHYLRENFAPQQNSHVAVTPLEPVQGPIIAPRVGFILSIVNQKRAEKDFWGIYYLFSYGYR